jgi:DNA-binding PadR family transcriptional regulator
MDLSISSDVLRGYTDTIILTQLMEKDSYGYEINKNVQRRTDGKHEFKEATLYTAFKRLSQNGLITSYWGEEGTGARRRYYKITEEGKAQWEARSREWQEARGLLDALLTVEVDYESN